MRVCIGVGGIKVCVIAKLCQNVCVSFYTIFLEYHRASVRHSGCMNELAFARIMMCSCECEI